MAKHMRRDLHRERFWDLDIGRNNTLIHDRLEVQIVMKSQTQMEI